jgi:hypothetical protein
MNTVVLKSYYLNKNLYWLFGAGALLATVIFLTFNISTANVYQIVMPSLGLGCIVLVYLNRLEPHYIKLGKDEFTVDCINKLIFKYGVKTYLKNQISVSLNKGVLVLYDNLGKKAIIREKAVTAEDWILIKEYFSQE